MSRSNENEARVGPAARMDGFCTDRDSLNKSDVKGHNLTPTVSLEPEENDASCQLELPESPSFEHICKKRCTDALLHSNLEQMRRERIKDCCDQLRVLLPYVKGRRTDVASILEMTVEYMRYIYDRIPNNIISQILEIFKTNSRYCKYVWKADDHKDSRYKLTSGRSGSTSNPSSEKIKSKIQYAPYQITGNEYFKNHKTDDASTMNGTFVYPKDAFESNQCYIPATKILIPQLQTSLSPNISPPSLVSVPFDVQNICLSNQPNSSIYLSTSCPNGSFPVFTPLASDIAKTSVASAPQSFSSDYLNTLSPLHSRYPVNPYSIISTSVTQSVNTTSSSAMTLTSINHVSTHFQTKSLTTPWSINEEERGTEGRQNVCNIFDQIALQGK